MRLKVDIVECPETGKIVDYVLNDENGRVVFRFGLVDECERNTIEERLRSLYCVTPDDLGLQTGQWVELDPVQ